MWMVRLARLARLIRPARPVWLTWLAWLIRRRTVSHQSSPPDTGGRTATSSVLVTGVSGLASSPLHHTAAVSSTDANVLP